MATVTLAGVEKSFGPTRILQGIDLHIPDGELMVLVGPSGCGKSTLLRCIAGLEEVTGGEVRIGERVVNALPPRDRDIAMVFQSYALYPHMTVRENLAFGLALRGTPPAEIARLCGEAAEMLELGPLMDRRPAQLSGGQRQRVAMGRAIVRRPAVFLFDEPLSNLDAALRVQMRAELLRLHQKLATTTVYVTHDQVEAMTLADRIAVLRGGVLQQCGPALELFERPANRFVAGFIGSPPMNFLAGQVQDGAVVGAGFRCPLPAGARAAPGARVLVGARPHALSLSPAGSVEARVEVVESLGWESHVFLASDAGPLVVRAESAAGIRPGDRTRVTLGEIHLFDAESEKALWHPSR